MSCRTLLNGKPWVVVESNAIVTASLMNDCIYTLVVLSEALVSMMSLLMFAHMFAHPTSALTSAYSYHSVSDLPWSILVGQASSISHPVLIPLLRQ